MGKDAITGAIAIDIPRIDYQTLHDAASLDALGAACAHWGLFRLVRHPLPPELLAELHAAMRALFELEPAVKRRIERTADNPWGYYDRELTKNRRDWKEIYDVGPASGSAAPQWPTQLPGFQRLIERYTRACTALGHELVGAIARTLGTPPAVLQQCFADHTSFLRLNGYPPCPEPAAADVPGLPEQGHLGIHHHTDAGALTVLSTDGQPGLQVLHDGRWHLVAAEPEALVINIGDVVQVWSNDRYPAPVHRVLANASAVRYSAAYFYNPGYAVDYAPLSAVCGQAHPARYRSINWGEFRAGRAAGDYADQGEEIQIAHFRI